VIGLMIIFNIGYYVVFTFLPTYFIKTPHFSKTNAFVSITLASLVALILNLPLAALSDRIGRRPMLIAGSLAFAFGGTTPYVVTWLTAQTANNVAPAYYVAAAAVVSLLTILTVKETARRPLPRRIGRNVPIGGVTVSGCRRQIPPRGPS
jgi:MFS family permease